MCNNSNTISPPRIPVILPDRTAAAAAASMAFPSPSPLQSHPAPPSIDLDSILPKHRLSHTIQSNGRARPPAGATPPATPSWSTPARKPRPPVNILPHTSPYYLSASEQQQQPHHHNQQRQHPHRQGPRPLLPPSRATSSLASSGNLSTTSSFLSASTPPQSPSLLQQPNARSSPPSSPPLSSTTTTPSTSPTINNTHNMYNTRTLYTPTTTTAPPSPSLSPMSTPSSSPSASPNPTGPSTSSAIAKKMAARGSHWSYIEKSRFEAALLRHGPFAWRAIVRAVGTRSEKQVKAYAARYRRRKKTAARAAMDALRDKMATAAQACARAAAAAATAGTGATVIRPAGDVAVPSGVAAAAATVHQHYPMATVTPVVVPKGLDLSRAVRPLEKQEDKKMDVHVENGASGYTVGTSTPTYTGTTTTSSGSTCCMPAGSTGAHDGYPSSFSIDAWQTSGVTSAKVEDVGVEFGSNDYEQFGKRAAAMIGMDVLGDGEEEEEGDEESNDNEDGRTQCVGDDFVRRSSCGSLTELGDDALPPDPFCTLF